MNRLTPALFSPQGHDKIIREPCMNAYLTLNLFRMFSCKCREINHFFPSQKPFAPVPLHFSGVFPIEPEELTEKESEEESK